jgi:hypothetical protein
MATESYVCCVHCSEGVLAKKVEILSARQLQSIRDYSEQYECSYKQPFQSLSKAFLMTFGNQNNHSAVNNKKVAVVVVVLVVVFLIMPTKIVIRSLSTRIL